MKSKIKRSIQGAARHFLPPRLKKFIFWGAFSVMTQGERDELSLQMASVEWSLRNIRSLGFRPRQIVDVGAYVGAWARMAKSIFPEAQVLMIEAQQGKEAELRRVCAEYPGEVAYRMSLLGAEERDGVEFYEHEGGSSVLFEQSSIERKKVQYPMRTLDAVAAGAGFGEAGLLKLDVQGYELEVLKGAPRLLLSAEAILMEVSLMEANRGAPLLHEVLGFMSERRFRTYDICSFMRRPLDHALWQSDFLFVKETSPLLADQSSQY
jgi:FkbM family methyltransferase